MAASTANGVNLKTVGSQSVGIPRSGLGYWGFFFLCVFTGRFFAAAFFGLLADLALGDGFAADTGGVSNRLSV